MTRLFIQGRAVPVTVLRLPQNQVVQVKTVQKDGYQAVQIGAFVKKHDTKPVVGHIKKHTGQETCFHCLGEFKTVLPEGKEVFSVADFAVNDVLKVTGRSVGKGFTGVVKRHGFRGQPKSHGHDHNRAPGSIGCRTEPGKVHKGTRMAGHQGNRKVTVTGVKVLAIDPEKELMFVSGSVPGTNQGFLKIQTVKH